MTIQDELQRIKNAEDSIREAKENIKLAIESKGVEVGGSKLSELPDKIEEITTGVQIDDGVIYRNPIMILEPSSSGEYMIFAEVEIFSREGVIINNSLNFYRGSKYSNDVEVPYDVKVQVILRDNIFEVGEYGLMNSIINDEHKLQSVRKVGNFSFYHTDISPSIVNRLEKIGESAFSYSEINGSVMLNDVEVMEGAFDNSKINGSLNVNLETIPEKLARNSTFTNLTFGPEVKYLDYDCFERCEIGEDGTFNLNIPEGILSSAYGAFAGSNIRSATTPRSKPFTTSKGYRMFNDCRFLIEANLKGGGAFDRVFYGCRKLKTVTLGSIGKPVTQITSSTFSDCPELTTITIHVNNILNPGLTGAPWGATGARIIYLPA